MQGIKRTGIMGGTFDPVHVAHLALAEAARERFGLDRVLFVVSAFPPHKPAGGITPAEARYEMVRLAVESNPYFQPCDLEMKRNTPSYTVDTVRELGELFPGEELYLILGMDEAQNFRKWREYETILKKCRVAAAWRPGSGEPDPELPVICFHAPEMNISSSDIRKRIAAGRSVRYLVPEAVYDYITEKGLYL
ncbi:MAG: nicotinate-nucleotide adenylyltransferase [Abditibacteriota bacterium]|nr:nicotinate-nucleotide adenylyltransferase [Abditibacteriota bacterium]